MKGRDLIMAIMESEAEDKEVVIFGFDGSIIEIGNPINIDEVGSAPYETEESEITGEEEECFALLIDAEKLAD